MTENPSYSPYSSQGGNARPVGNAVAPASILTAVKLMYVGAVVTLMSSVYTLLTLKTVRAAVEKARPGISTAGIHAAMTVAEIVAVVGASLGIAFWIWMAKANKKGHGWARIVSTVLFGIDTLSLLLALRGAAGMAQVIFGVLVWLIGLAAIVFLWKRPSSEYFLTSA